MSAWPPEAVVVFRESFLILFLQLFVVGWDHIAGLFSTAHHRVTGNLIPQRGGNSTVLEEVWC